jgi:hypothetical protein
MRSADGSPAPSDGLARYEAYKRAFNDTERDCCAAGFAFLPAIWDGDGGAGPAADRLLRRLADDQAAYAGGRRDERLAELRVEVWYAIAYANGTALVLRRPRDSTPPADAVSGAEAAAARSAAASPPAAAAVSAGATLPPLRVPQPPAAATPAAAASSSSAGAPRSASAAAAPPTSSCVRPVSAPPALSRSHSGPAVAALSFAAAAAVPAAAEAAATASSSGHPSAVCPPSAACPPSPAQRSPLSAPDNAALAPTSAPT